MRIAAHSSLRVLVVALALVGLAGAGLAEALPNGNPANRMLNKPIDEIRYDRATSCRKHPTRGIIALQGWLQNNAKGVPWGTVRCEKWGKNSASLHAEGRALDWHLDAGVPGQRRAAERLIRMLLATDRRGNVNALARRMGVQEIIWNCKYWGGWSSQMGRYSACYNRKGKRIKNVNRTAAHMDHIHFGINWRGARMKTSFWAR